MARLTDNSRIVAAVGQDEGDAGFIYEIDFVHRLPGSDMVPFGGDNEHRDVDITQGDRHALNAIAPLEKIVVQIEAPKILAVHAVRHVSGIGIPGK